MKIYKTLPDGTQIVEYDDSLAPAVADMWNRSGEGWGGAFSDGVWDAEHVIAKKEGGAFFNIYIAMKDGEAIGYCSFDRYYKDEDTAYVHVLNVRPDYHGKKIGKALVLMCVEETIARGIPRLDIHTWPGNTKSVPLYKKCGFQWEDRSDTTHLCNFIPTVLSTDLLCGYFKKADWYADSTRMIMLKPDGIKVDKFEFFEYEWEKDGQRLRVGFEKTGRRIRLIETDDYKIEMTADNHELAFGLSYNCRFHVVNKTGKELNIEIAAKNDGVIAFEGGWAETVARETIFEGTFFVNAITGALDPWRMHPCVLADVRVNGRHVEFGLGIEPKFPVTVSINEERQVAKPGISENVYISIKNDLPRDATVKFTLCENPLVQFEQIRFEARLTRGKNTMLSTSSLVKECGYTCLPVTYEIFLDNGETISFTRSLHLINQGLNGQFAFETDQCYGAANGLWRLRLDKQSNTVNYDRIIPSGHGEFNVSKLGIPYDDEFNLMTPADVRTSFYGQFVSLEADFVSKRFKGAVLTEVYEFDAAGTLKRRHRVTNTGDKPLCLSVRTEFWTSVGGRAVFHYDGDFHGVADNMNYGFETLVHAKLDENWIFDANPECPAGVCWPPQYKPHTQWGDLFKFEFSAGELAAGQSFEIEPVIYMCGIFKDFRDFRNYVLGIHDKDMPFVRNHLETVVNGYNPVLSSDTLPLNLRNNRLNIWEGSVTVSSPDGLFAEETQINPKDFIRSENMFAVPVSPGKSGVCDVNFALHFVGHDREIKRALLITDGTRILTEDRDGVLTLTNGILCYSLSPGFSDAVYSLKYGGNEWFYSRYPALEPYSWWNPFVGGLKSYLERMNNILVLREKITASFTTCTDTLGNLWTGIRADVTVNNADEYKGVCYAQYYLTLPGVPVLCHFTRLENGMGRYLDAEMYTMMFLSGKEDLQDLRAAVTAEDKSAYHLKMGRDDREMRFDRLLMLSREGKDPRSEKMYIFKDSVRDRGRQVIGYDQNIAFYDANMKGRVHDGAYYSTKPVFCILTEKELSLDSLTDLSRISFNNKH